jgi:hypothetical protein
MTARPRPKRLSRAENHSVVRLTADEADVMHRIYADGSAELVTGRLAAFIALLHLCGFEHEAPPPNRHQFFHDMAQRR